MDIIQVLRDEHRQVLELFETFDALSEPSAKTPVAEQLLQQLMVHEEAEEDAVYKQVQGLLADPDLVDTILLEQADLKDRIREIVSDPNAETLASRVLLLRERVMDHVATEQNELFPMMLEFVPEGMRQNLAASFKTAKAGHMVEFPNLSITMAPESPVEERQKH